MARPASFAVGLAVGLACFPRVAFGDDEEEVRVRAEARPPRPSTEVARDEARQVAGSQGDVVRAVENLPGVGRSAPGSGQIVVWGAAPESTRVYLDGLPIPRLYHDGGYRSVIHPDMVGSVELLPGGYGPAFGRGLGGVVAVKTLAPEESGVHGSVAADVLDASASLRAALDRRLSLAVAVRRSHLEEALSAVSREEVGDVVPIPRWHDGHVRLGYAIAPGERFELGGLVSSDATTRTILSNDPLATRSERRELGFSRAYVRYDKQMADGAVASALPFFGTERTRFVQRFGGVPVESDIDARVFGLRLSWRGVVVRDIRATVGLDALFTASEVERAGSIGAPPREGDARHFGQRPPEQIGADTFKNVVGSLAPHGELDVPLPGGFHLVPGARVEPYLTTTNRKTPKVAEVPAVGSARQETVIEPRLALRFSPSPVVAMTAGYGHYHQSPPAEDLSAVFGNPGLGIARAEHWTLGTKIRPAPGLDIELTSFLALQDDLPSRSRAREPALAQALAPTGDGRTVGTQILLRRRRVGGRLSGWLAYTLARSRRRDAESSGWRLSDHDQTHVLTAVASYDLGFGFDVGVRARVATGAPRTAVVAAVQEDRTDAYLPRFGPVNGTRLPAFFALDARVSKRIKLGPTEAEVYLEVLNVTDHENVEEIAYSTTYRQRGSITGLSILPVAGARLSW